MAGRPTTYSSELEEQAWEYINNYQDHEHIIPSVVGLCHVINRARSTIYEWAKHKDKGFSDILEAVNEHQELKALNGGLTGDLNAQITKLVLGKHGYHDKQDVDAKTAVTVEIVQFSEDDEDPDYEGR